MKRVYVVPLSAVKGTMYGCGLHAFLFGIVGLTRNLLMAVAVCGSGFLLCAKVTPLSPLKARTYGCGFPAFSRE
ncbi:MAG: hypothetical protein BGO70_18085 [Bacteroidetes bacterium 43-93]|nr:MAG: hypothetical protein BGO70_18085 [Bacteroidetes bacterium 43-93]